MGTIDFDEAKITHGPVTSGELPVAKPKLSLRELRKADEDRRYAARFREVAFAFMLRGVAKAKEAKRAL